MFLFLIQGKNEELMSHDLWLIGQLGVALLSWCKQNQTWQDGFLVLHCLHLHGIHYVNVPPPYAIKPPLSSCAVALRAVEVCLKVIHCDSQIMGSSVVGTASHIGHCLINLVNIWYI